jgi:hypothetical protein
MSDFPLEHLSVRDGALSLAAGAHPPLPYLATGAVRITGKNNLVDLGAGVVSFMFALSEAPDPTWVAAFVAARSGQVAEIQGAQVDLHCKPADLETSFLKLKDLIAQTNARYEQTRAEVIEQVARLERTRPEQATAAADHFDRLKL